VKTDWPVVPIWTVAEEIRHVVEPAELDGDLFHYSIPVVEEIGTGRIESAQDLGSTKLLLSGDEVLISKLNPRKGRVLIAKRLGVPIVASPEFIALRPNGGIIDRFLAYLLASETTRLRLDANVQSVTRSHQRVTPELVRHLKFACPPLDDQRRIADFLDAETARIDGLATAQNKAKKLLLERRAAKVFGLVTGAGAADRMPSQLAWATSLPVIWQSVKLGHFARMGSGHTPSRSHPEWWEDCTIPWITTGEVSQVRDDRREVLTETRECISEVGLANSAAELHPKDTVVLCRTASAGYSAVMGEDMATSQDFVTWTCGPSLDPFYLLWCLRAMRSDLLGRLAMGSTHKTIYVPDLQALRIPLPQLSEQRQIVGAIRASNAAIDAAVDVIDRQAGLLAERRQALITAAVTGGITV
jgi:type I restriction enzyme, S subunit